jgi:hypothetical protein
MEQIIGRGIRTCSHSLLDETKRNCTIYLLVNSYNNESETADMYLYRIAIIKAIEMGRVTRILKRYAIDCNLNRKAIINTNLDNLDRIEDSQGNIRTNVSINDTPFTSMCDWMECSYSCSKPVDVEQLINKSELSTISYDEYSMNWRESQIKGIIKRFFEKNMQVMIQIENLFDILKSAGIPEVAMIMILSRIVNNPSFVINVNGQDGYLTYKNTYYLFQPMKLIDRSIPIALRVANTIIRKDEYEPKDIRVEITMKPSVKRDTRIVENTVEVEKPASDIKDINKLWNEVLKWAKTIEGDTSAIDIPPEIINLLSIHYSDDNIKKRIISHLSTITSMIMIIKQMDTDENKTKYNKYLAEVLLEFIWDECMNNDEQQTIFNRDINDIIAKESDDILKGVVNEQLYLNDDRKIFLYVSLISGEIEYSCNNIKCNPILIDSIKKDPKFVLNKLKLDKNKTGDIYGFIIPKSKTDQRLIFKTSTAPSVDTGKPNKGKECESQTSISDQKNDLIKIREMINNLGYPSFILDAKRIEEKHGIKGAVNACAIKNIILRFIDINENNKGLKRYFYRPLSAIKTNHYLNQEPSIKKSVSTKRSQMLMKGGGYTILSPASYAIPVSTV